MITKYKSIIDGYWKRSEYQEASKHSKSSIIKNNPSGILTKNSTSSSESPAIIAVTKPSSNEGIVKRVTKEEKPVFLISVSADELDDVDS